MRTGPVVKICSGCPGVATRVAERTRSERPTPSFHDNIFTGASTSDGKRNVRTTIEFIPAWPAAQYVGLRVHVRGIERVDEKLVGTRVGICQRVEQSGQPFGSKSGFDG